MADIITKFGKKEDLPRTITPGAIYYVQNDETNQGEIFYDFPTAEAGEPASSENRRSVVGGGIYIGSDPIPKDYTVRIDPEGSVTGLVTETSDGLMRAEDKRRLDQLWNYFGNLKIIISNSEPEDVNEPASVNTVTIVVPE